ncbi:MAG: hypothetical protein ACRYFL_07310 [Janthinobacterium lividum]
MSKPVSFIKSTWWSIVDKKRYRLNKLQVHQQKIESFLSNNKILTIPDIIKIAQANGELNHSHTGNAGDIIYALPVIKQLSNLIDKLQNLLLKINVPMRLSLGLVHPLNNVMLNEQSVKLLSPLLESQSYISKCSVYTDERIDIDLSLFRKSGIYIDRGNQSFPYSLAEGLKVPRILETYYSAPNVIPEGKNGHDFYFQKHFEFLVEDLYYS